MDADLPSFHRPRSSLGAVGQMTRPAQGDDMNFDRLKAAAMAAIAVLAISGTATVFAATPSSPPAGGATPVVATTPAPVVGSSSAPVVATTPAPAATEQPESSASAEPTEAAGGTEPTAAETTTVESDGPGGHQDPAGQNVDHQFDGQE
jgi:hypothetical protein